MSDDTVQVALLLDSESIQEWHRIALREMLDRTPSTIDLLVINQRTNDEKSQKSRSNVTPWRIYNAVRARFETDDKLRSYRRRHHIENVEFLSRVERRYCEAVPADGLGNKLPPDVVEALSSHDMAVRFGFGILVGDALNAPKHGVLSYHHGDFREYRGRPAGFWEFVEGSPTVGITLQRLNETLDGGEVVAFNSIDISSVPSWPAVMAMLLSESGSMLADGVETLTDPNCEPDTLNELGELYLAPRWRDLGRYLLRRVQRALSA